MATNLYNTSESTGAYQDIATPDISFTSLAQEKAARLADKKESLTGDRQIKPELSKNSPTRSQGYGDPEYMKDPDAYMFVNAPGLDEVTAKERGVQNYAKIDGLEPGYYKKSDLYEPQEDTSTGDNRMYSTDPEVVKQYQNEKRLANMNWLERAGDEVLQTGASAVAGVGRGAVGLVQGLGELVTYVPQEIAKSVTGDDSIDYNFFSKDTEEKVNKGINELVGYNAEEDSVKWDRGVKALKDSGIDVTSWDSIKDVLSDPEKRSKLGSGLADVIDMSNIAGMITEITGAGGALGAVGKGAAKLGDKAIDAARGVKAEEAAANNGDRYWTDPQGILNVELSVPKEGVISEFLKSNKTKGEELLKVIDKSSMDDATKALASAQVAKDYSSIDKKISDLVIKGNATTNALTITTANDWISEYEKNNEGREATLGEKLYISTLARMAAPLEAIAYDKALKIPDAVARIAAKDTFSKVATAAAAEIAGAAGIEGGQELVNGLIGLYATQLDTDKYKGMSYGELVANSSADLIAQTVAGAVGGAGAKTGAVGIAIGMPKELTDKLTNMVSTATENSTAITDSALNDSTVEVSPEKVQAYAKNLFDIRTAFQENKITADTLPSYMDQIESLYDLRTGITGVSKEEIAKADETYKKVASRVNDIIISNPELALKKIVTPEVLGSSPDSTIPHDKSLDTGLATRVLMVALDGAEPSSLEGNLQKYLDFGARHGIDTTEIKDLVKNFESVEEEATIGDRGYLTYAARIKSLMASTNPDNELIGLYAAKLTKFENSTSKSIDQIQGLLNKAEALATKLNSSKVPAFKKVERVFGDYTKLDGQKLSVDVKKVEGGTWIVTNDGHAKSILEAKQRTLQGISKALSSTGTVNKADESSIGSLLIPAAQVSEKIAKARKQDTTSLNAWVAEAAPVIGGKSINKVLVDYADKAHGDKWKLGNDYSKANTAIVNTGSYDSSDVVLLHAIGMGKVGTDGKSYVSKLSYTKPGKDGTVYQAAEEFRKAVNAGAAIVLDTDYFQLGKDKKLIHQNELVAVTKLLKSSGYVEVPTAGSNGKVYVKNTTENSAAIEAIKSDVAAKKALEDEEVKAKNTLISKELSVRAREMGLIEATKEQLDEARKRRDEAFASVRDKYFSAGEYTNTPQERLTAFVNNEVNKAILTRAEEFGTSEKGDKYDAGITKREALALLAREHARKAKEDSAEIANLLTEWKAALGLRLPENETKDRVEQLLKDSNIAKLVDMDGNLVKLGKDLLDQSISKGAGKRYITTKNGKTTITSDKTKLNEEGITSIVEIDADITSYVAKKADTLLSTIVVSALPSEIKGKVEKFQEQLTRTIMSNTGSRKLGDTVISNADVNRNFWLVDSPARGLVFNESGKVSPQVAAAMWLATMEMIKADKHKLTLGARSRKDVAAQLNIPETMVTKEQMEFAKTNGMLNKTMANSLGKSILAELGLGKKGNDEISKGHYETLAADLGNMAIITGEKLGWFGNTQPSVEKVSKFYGNPIKEEGKGDKNAVVYYINISSSALGKDKALKGDLGANYKVYEEAADILPSVNTSRKEPFAKLTEEQINRNLTSVRNDVTGGTHQIPEEAKTMLRNLMNTKFKADLSGIREFLKLVDADDSNIKQLLGWIDLDEKNPAYNALSFDDKDIQVSINRDVEKSIEELRKFAEAHNDMDAVDIQYLFYYTSNGRYMMDANTVNPQTDKLHRFFIQPVQHELTYTVQSNKFSVDGKDVTYGVKLALAQALGMDIDKELTKDISNAMEKVLNATPEEINQLKKEVIAKGKGKINGVEVKAEHLSHTLQAIKFLEDKQSGTVTSSLTAEFDSVTNGFMNKLMQLPILDNMKEHLARVGILHKDYLVSQELDTLLDLENGEAVNAILSKQGALKGFLDSYKNLANIVGKKLEEHLNGKDPDPVISSLRDYLPKADNGVISKELRSLFKSPFMTFNYSASIKSIVQNLSMDLALELLNKVISTDPSKEKEAREIAKILLGHGVHIRDANGATKKLPAESFETSFDVLKTYIRTKPTKDLRMNGKSLVDSLAQTHFASTYGKFVETAFNDEFEAFIKLQDTINDAYKVTFRMFEHKLNTRLKEIQYKKKYVTEQDYKDVIKELWKDFPTIRGPLSSVIDGVGYDTIPVVGTTSKSNDSDVGYRDKAQTKLEGTGNVTQSRVVYAVMKFLAEVDKAGSVLPFHYIDGAELGKTFNTLYADNAFGATPIHDAMMVPVTHFGQATYEYNRNTVEVNRSYSLMDAMKEMVDKWDLSNVPKNLPTASINAAGKANSSGKQVTNTDFQDVAKKVQEDIRLASITVAEKRKELLYGGNALSNYTFNNLVGDPSGYYVEGSTGPAKISIPVDVTPVNEQVISAPLRQKVRSKKKATRTSGNLNSLEQLAENCK